jgi:predicted peptidase
MRLLAFLLIPFTAFAAPTESRESLEWKQDEKLPFLQILPEGYEEASEASLPLVVFLHGAGERGTNLDMLKKHGPPKFAMNGHGFPFILAAPQCPPGRWWNPDEIIALTKHLAKNLKVDTKRIHLTGLSMGGFGTWACLAKEPGLYASGVPICGGGDPTSAKILKDIPIWTFHGNKDEAVPVAKTEEMEKAIRGAGGKKLLATYYPDEGHESWIPAYADPALFAWMMLQHR